MPIFLNPAKSGFSQICNWICWVTVKLQYDKIITDETNAADLSSGVCAIVLSVTWMTKIQNSLPFHKFYHKLTNSDVMLQRKH